jgi:hypothetical protein
MCAPDGDKDLVLIFITRLAYERLIHINGEVGRIHHLVVYQCFFRIHVADVHGAGGSQKRAVDIPARC